LHARHKIRDFIAKKSSRRTTRAAEPKRAMLFIYAIRTRASLKHYPFSISNFHPHSCGPTTAGPGRALAIPRY
jgi:hypothetical protein